MCFYHFWTAGLSVGQHEHCYTRALTDVALNNRELDTLTPTISTTYHLAPPSFGLRNSYVVLININCNRTSNHIANRSTYLI